MAVLRSVSMRIAALAAVSLSLAAWLCRPYGAVEPARAAAPIGAAASEPIRAAFGHVDITPKIEPLRPVYLAGYGPNRIATGVHDPLYARGVVLGIGKDKIALVCVDLVGLQYPAVQKIRAQLADFKYVVVASTHNHEGPDVIGIWGPSPLRCGVDFEYVDKVVVAGVVKLVRDAEKKLVPVRASYGIAEDESLLGDSRLPKVYDGVLRVLRFDPIGSDAAKTSAAPGAAKGSASKPVGVLIQWNCHPEALGSRNKLVTADFPAATVAAVEKQYGCPVAYFSGAVGGLMAPPRGVVKSDKGEPLKDGSFEYARAYGESVAKLAAKALDAARPIDLSSVVVSAKAIGVRLDNPLYKLARAAGVLRREGRVWTGDSESLGEPITAANADQPPAVETEVAYVRLGELHVACIPGELYPELVYGKFQDPVDPGADFPDAPLEKPVMRILPGAKALILGLANDELGYIIPKRQWDRQAPYCYGRDWGQYGEINSCGPDVAPILMQALEKRVREAGR